MCYKIDNVSDIEIFFRLIRNIKISGYAAYISFHDHGSGYTATESFFHALQRKEAGAIVPSPLVSFEGITFVLLPAVDDRFLFTVDRNHRLISLMVLYRTARHVNLRSPEIVIDCVTRVRHISTQMEERQWF